MLLKPEQPSANENKIELTYKNAGVLSRVFSCSFSEAHLNINMKSFETFIFDPASLEANIPSVRESFKETILELDEDNILGVVLGLEKEQIHDNQRNLWVVSESIIRYLRNTVSNGNFPAAPGEPGLPDNQVKARLGNYVRDGFALGNIAHQSRYRFSHLEAAYKDIGKDTALMFHQIGETGLNVILNSPPAMPTEKTEPIEQLLEYELKLDREDVRLIQAMKLGALVGYTVLSYEQARSREVDSEWTRRSKELGWERRRYYWDSLGDYHAHKQLRSLKRGLAQ